jgi:ribosomal protein L15
MKLVSIKPANNGKNKYTAIFEKEGKNIIRHFGAFGMKDYTLYSKQSKEIADERRRLYLERHKKEDWTDPLKAGTLSRFLLWEYPSLTKAISAYKKRFNL